jgi:hypothetical protein
MKKQTQVTICLPGLIVSAIQLAFFMGLSVFAPIYLIGAAIFGGSTGVFLLKLWRLWN